MRELDVCHCEERSDAAISCIRKRQLRYVFHVGDCHARKLARNDMRRFTRHCEGEARGNLIHREKSKSLRFALFCYKSSCSSDANSIVLKKSVNVMLRPSHNIFRVTMPGFLLVPYKIFLIVEGGTADSKASL